MAESRQNLDDVLGLQGKAGGITVLHTLTASPPPQSPAGPPAAKGTDLVGRRAPSHRDLPDTHKFEH